MAKVKLDLIDKQIIQILQEDCKITNLELSKRIGLSPAPTLERVKKLEVNNVLSSYHARVEPTSIGLQVQTYILAKISWSLDNAMDRFVEKVKEIDEIVECYVITGDADVLLKVICEDIPAYESLLFQTLSRLEEVSQLKTLMTLSQVKDSKVLPFKYDQ